MSRYYDWLESVTPEEYPERHVEDGRDEDTLTPPPRTVVRPMSREEFDAVLRAMTSTGALMRRQAG